MKIIKEGKGYKDKVVWEMTLRQFYDVNICVNDYKNPLATALRRAIRRAEKP